MPVGRPTTSVAVVVQRRAIDHLQAAATGPVCQLLTQTAGKTAAPPPPPFSALLVV